MTFLVFNTNLVKQVIEKTLDYFYIFVGKLTHLFPKGLLLPFNSQIFGFLILDILSFVNNSLLNRLLN